MKGDEEMGNLEAPPDQDLTIELEESQIQQEIVWAGLLLLAIVLLICSAVFAGVVFVSVKFLGLQNSLLLFLAIAILVSMGWASAENKTINQEL